MPKTKKTVRAENPFNPFNQKYFQVYSMDGDAPIFSRAVVGVSVWNCRAFAPRVMPMIMVNGVIAQVRNWILSFVEAYTVARMAMEIIIPSGRNKAPPAAAMPIESSCVRVQ